MARKDDEGPIREDEPETREIEPSRWEMPMATTSIERTQPMRIHKNVIIRVLRQRPEDFELLVPDYPGTMEDFIKAVENSPGQYFTRGELEEETQQK